MKYLIKALLTVVLVLLLAVPSLAFKHELYYSKKWCAEHNGIAEYTLAGGVRVDCLTSDLAVEVDWAKKWAEGIGQAILYATLTEKVPAVLLLIKEPSDYVYIKRVYQVINRYNLPIQVITLEVR